MQESFWWWQYSVMYGLLFPPPPEFSVPASSSSVGDNLALNGFNQGLPGSRRNIIHCRHSSQTPSWMRYYFASHFAATWSRSLKSGFTLPGVDLRRGRTFLDREPRFKILWSDAEWRPPSQLSSNRSWTDYCPLCFFLHCRVEFATRSTTSIIPSSDKISLKQSYLWDPSHLPHSYSPAVSWSQLVQECYVPCQLVFNFAASVSIFTLTFSSLLSLCFIFAIISNKASPERTQFSGRKTLNVLEITAVL